jgi:two-component sensor histidine kinase
VRKKLTSPQSARSSAGNNNRKRIEAELKYRVELQAIISKISTQFITLPTAKIDDAVDRALAEIGAFAGVDRCYIFLSRDNGVSVDNTHEWCAEGIVPQKPSLQGLDSASFPWWREQLTNLEAIHIPRVSALPPEAHAEKEFIQARRTQSVLVVPLTLGGLPIGFLGFDSIREEKTWTEVAIPLLQIVGEIFVNALERRKTEEALKTRTEQIIRHQEALLELAKMEYPDMDSGLKKITEMDARTMGVERVSIWFFTDNRSEIYCRDLYRADSHSHDKGMSLQAKEHPRYFKALEKSRVLAATDASTDPRTSEFAAGYLKPLGISSLLDIPFRLHGQLAGIVCHEHTGPRREWTLEEQQFAVSIGDLVSLTLESLERRRMEKVKNSIFQISEAAISSESLDELFRSIHRIIGELMPAKNFYISLYDPLSAILSFPYFVDEFDPPPSPKPLGKGLTEYVLRRGEPLLASPEIFEGLVREGEVESIGAPSIDWLGVPLKIDGKIIGVLVVQSYTEGVRYGEEGKNILRFVSDQVAMVIHRKQAEEALRVSLREKEVLLREIHHRVKNNMQVISSLLNLQARHILDPAVLAMFQESQRRIRAMALVHEKLYLSKDLSSIEFSEYLESLALHLSHFFQVDPHLIRLKMNMEKIFMNISTAIPCGLIVNELVSNSLKHAFPEGRGGELRIELRRTGAHKFLLIVGDSGIGFPAGLDFRSTDTLGMQIVTMLVDQLDGHIELDRQDGTSFRIAFEEQRSKQSARGI